MRFSAVGAGCLALGAAVLAGLHELAGVNYLVAYAASFVASNIAGYVLNARFTFSLKAVSRAGAVRYMTVNGALLCANTLAMKLLVDGLHLWYITAAVLLGGLVTPVSFLAQRIITYRAHVGNRLGAL
jgi:putative flippase GtrA